MPLIVFPDEMVAYERGSKVEQLYDKYAAKIESAENVALLENASGLPFSGKGKCNSSRVGGEDAITK